MDAEKHLTEGLAFPTHPWIAKNRTALEESLASARANVAEVIVEGSPAGAEVLVNGRSVGILPLTLPLHIGKGSVEIELRASGYIPASRALAISGGDKQTLVVVLDRASPANRVTAATEEHPSLATISGSGTEVNHSAQSSVRRISGWATAAAAAATLVFSIGETVRWLEKQDQFDNHTGPLPSDASVLGKELWQ